MELVASITVATELRVTATARFTRDPRGARYEIVGPAMDGHEVAVICRIKATGKLLFITASRAE